MRVPFNRPHLTGHEFTYISEAVEGGQLAGNGPFTQRCHMWLERELRCARALLTHSCTAALEMAALLLDPAPGDEIIMPSFTFVSTANAFVLRGARPVFVDIRPDTLNIDETLIEAAITDRTRAIVPVHYGGVACDMDAIMDIAQRHNLVVVEDAAQGFLAGYRSRPLGSIGHLAALSFHETKNVISGEGGALLINDDRFRARAEIIWEKGTNRSHFLRGEVEKYTWVDIGSSFLPGELTAAFLWAQLESAHEMTTERLRLWNRYASDCAALERVGVRCPIVPDYASHNAHLFYLLLPPSMPRAEVLADLNTRGVNAIFHYVPLHESAAGRRYGRVASHMDVTTSVSSRLIRLPLWIGLNPSEMEFVIASVAESLTQYV
ncbi:MAG TPA: dTDP-4-amino-4,6-dideoxygalactose transaminase [Vicinamibacterales bacterium]|nr:dTDP-4-amino-4,6-dideoxygalactose transaminase [Vicinamibacterales bacterium]